jgi:hypothetical protein
MQCSMYICPKSHLAQVESVRVSHMMVHIRTFELELVKYIARVANMLNRASSATALLGLCRPPDDIDSGTEE